MTTGTISIQVNGAQTVIEVPDIERTTAAQVNELFAAAGVGDHVHCLTPAEQELARQAAEVREAKRRVATIEELRREDQDELREVMHDHGFTRALEELTNDELSQVVSSLIPDSY